MQSFSNSSKNFLTWYKESWLLFRALCKSVGAYRNSLSKILEYENILQRHSGKLLVDSNVLEIGFGARPFQLASLANHVRSYHGVDSDIALLPGDSLLKFFSIWSSNGFFRAVRSIVRSVFFDRRIYKSNNIWKIAKSKKFKNNLHVFTFGRDIVWPFDISKVDFIFSEDVFEHIPQEFIEIGLSQLASVLNPNCILLIRPNIFTGITGGHDPEYYPDRIGDLEFLPRMRPWEHLYEDSKLEYVTFLNRLRYRQYCELFQEHFEILEVYSDDNRLGERFFRKDLVTILRTSEEELFMNQVAFILRKRGYAR